MSGKASIGQVFRQQREARGLSVEQAAFQSKVPLRLLQALESDDYHLLPDPMYLIRFLHEYALFLKLDPALLEGEFQEAIRRPPKTSLAAAPPPPPKPVIPWKQVLWTTAAILVVIPLVFIALSLSSRRPPEAPPPPQEPARPAAEQSPEAGSGMPDWHSLPRPEDGSVSEALGQKSPEARPETRGTVRPAAIEAANQPPAPTGSARLVLIIRATEPAWVSVRSDTGGRRQVLLQTGQSATFDAEKGFLVTLGNVGGVALALNGVSLPILGKSGEVIRDLPVPLAKRRIEPSPTGPER